MLFIMLIFVIALSILIITISEAKHFAIGYIGVFMLLLLTGMSLAQEGIIIDYGTHIQQGINNDMNQTSVTIDQNTPLVLTTTNDATTNYLATIFTYGSFLFFLLFIFRQDSFSKQETYKSFGINK